MDRRKFVTRVAALVPLTIAESTPSMHGVQVGSALASRRESEIPLLDPAMGPMNVSPWVSMVPYESGSSIPGATLLAAPSLPLTYTGNRAAAGPNPDAYSPHWNAANDGSRPLYVPGPWGVLFDYDGRNLEFVFAGGGGRYRLSVVGEGYESRNGNALLPDGSYHIARYDFGTARKRQILVDLPQFVGIFKDPAATISTTSLGPRPRVVTLGDSFTEGTGAGAPFTSFNEHLGNYLRWEVIPSGWGGTGYTADYSGAGRTKFRTRLQRDVINQNPDVVILTGGINDSSGYVPGFISAEITGILEDIAAYEPNLPVVVLGPFWPNGRPIANVVGIRDELRVAADAWGHLFIDNLGGPYPYTGNDADYVNTGWITGTGDAGVHVGDGNADIYTSADGTHPTQEGHDFLALKIAEAILASAPGLKDVAS